MDSIFWPATVDIFTGILAKEAVVETLDAMYTQIGAATAAEDGEAEGFDFWGGIAESFATIPENLMGVAGTLLDPLGISLGDVSTVETAAEEQAVAVTDLFNQRTNKATATAPTFTGCTGSTP